jgi:TPR repeat protein
MLNRLGKYFEWKCSSENKLELAAECYRHAATKDFEAGVNYGFFLEQGLGVDRNVSRSVEFYENSMCGGNWAGE